MPKLISLHHMAAIIVILYDWVFKFQLDNKTIQVQRQIFFRPNGVFTTEVSLYIIRCQFLLQHNTLLTFVNWLNISFLCTTCINLQVVTEYQRSFSLCRQGIGMSYSWEKTICLTW